MSDMEVDQSAPKGKEKKESGKPRFEVKKVWFLGQYGEHSMC
jgi:hypothetical protein